MATYDVTGRDRINPDPILTNISVEFANKLSFVGNRLFPKVRVAQQAGRYRIYGRRHFALNYSGDVRAPATRANEIEGFTQWATDTYFATEHALEMPVPPEEREAVRNDDLEANPDADAVEDLTAKILLGKELACRNLVYDTTQYKADHIITLGAGAHFDEYGTSDPITVFRDAFRTFHSTMGTVPNLAVIPWGVMSFLEDHPDIIARYANQDGMISAQQIAAILGIREVIIPGGTYNSQANPGLDAALAEIWGNHIVLAYTTGRPSLRTPNFGYEFLWPIPGGGRRGPDDISVDRRFDNDNITDIHRVRRRYDLKLVGRDPDLTGEPVVAGMLIRDVLTAANA